MLSWLNLAHVFGVEALEAEVKGTQIEVKGIQIEVKAIQIGTSLFCSHCT